MAFLTYIVILTGSITTDYFLIKKHEGSYRGTFKAVVIGVFYLMLLGSLFLHEGNFLAKICLVPFMANTWMIVKDASLGWLLHRDLLYAGTGTWDSMWQPKSLFILKLLNIAPTVVMVFKPSWFAVGWFMVVWGLMIILTYKFYKNVS